MEKDVSNPKLARVQEKGQVTLPADVRRMLGIKKGDVVSFSLTQDGSVLLTPQQTIASRDIDEADRLLREQGLSLDEIIENGRSIRSRLIKEAYGIDTDQ
jgi:AbrB family looped-hinge helix DNA binding protein